MCERCPTQLRGSDDGRIVRPYMCRKAIREQHVVKRQLHMSLEWVDGHFSDHTFTRSCHRHHSPRLRVSSLLTPTDQFLAMFRRAKGAHARHSTGELLNLRQAGSIASLYAGPSIA